METTEQLDHRTSRRSFLVKGAAVAQERSARGGC